MILLIDNYDSFTFNLVHFLGDLGARCEVRRNDALTRGRGAGAGAGGDRAVARPLHAERGRHLPRADRRRRRARSPILGVCLGHQAIGQAFGGEVVRAPAPMHGKVTPVLHDGTDIFAGMPSPFQATRYHSLVVRRDTPAADAGGNRPHRGRADHGPAPPHAAGVRRAVPPGEHRQRARPPPSSAISWRWPAAATRPPRRRAA